MDEEQQQKTDRVVRPNGFPDKFVMDDTHTKGGMFDTYIEMAENMTPEQRKRVEDMGLNGFEELMGGESDE